MSNLALISIVTPSFNQVPYIAEALRSVKDQRFPAVEHIVIDGGSTDGTVEYLQSLSGHPDWRHLRWISEPDNGQSEALNKGFRMATGGVIGWLNSDDRYRPGCFEKVAGAFSTNSAVDVLYGDFTWIDEHGRFLQIRREVTFNPFVLLYHRTLCVPSPSSFFRRKIFDDGNFIDVSFDYSMDWEFFVRLHLNGYRFQHLQATIADFRWQPNSKSSKCLAGQHRDRDRILDQYAAPLQKCPPATRPLCLLGLRSAAALRYWSEKFVRGYYFERWFQSGYELR